MGELLLYLSAVARQWVAIVTGGVVSVIALVLGKFAGFEPPPYVWLVIFVLGLFVAFFLAWRNEHRALLLTQGISVILEQVVTGFTTEDEREVAIAAVTAAISNRGSPAAVLGLRLTATPPGASPSAGYARRVVGSFAIAFPGGSDYIVHGDESLLERAQKQPIPTGGIVHGSMLYAFEDVAVATLAGPGVVFELIATDAYGNAHNHCLTAKGTVDGGVTQYTFPTMRPHPQEPTRKE